MRAWSSTAALSCALGALLSSTVRAAATDVDVRSANGRYAAEVRGGELAVYEPRKGEERRKQWSGLHACAGRAAHFLTDDGGAFVHVGAQARAKQPLVEVIRRGLRSAALDAPALEIDPDASDGSWIDLDLGDLALRLRREGGASDRHDMLDLLGRDQRVRTIDLLRGELALSPSRSLASEVRVEPGLDAIAPRGEPVYVARAVLPALHREGEIVEVEVTGSFPTPDWKLLGFEIERGAAADELVLRPRAVPGSGVSAQVLRPFSALARIGGLAPGAYRGRLDGRAGSPALESGGRGGWFAFEVLPRDLVVSLRTSGGIAAISSTLRVHADGRYEVAPTAKASPRVALAPVAAWRALERAVAALPDAPETRPASQGADFMTYELVWLGAEEMGRPGRPRRVVRDDMTLDGPYRALVRAVQELAAPRPEAAQPARYRIDPAASTLAVKTTSSGLLGVFGHGHTIAARTFSGLVELEPGRFDAARLELSIEVSSLAVVDPESRDDAAEIEKEMRTAVLETARYPEIVFTSTQVAATPLGEKTWKLRITGELVLHGKTRTVTIPAYLSIEDDVLHALGGIQLRQTDWNIRPTSIAGGAVKVADEVELTFDVTARR